ncbi:MAG: S9 family peptidase, partial [Thermomonas sp.]
MSHLSNACLIAGLAIAGSASAQSVTNDDPYAWLEDVQGEKSLDWVKARNAKSEAEIASSAEFKTLETQIRAILDSDAKIPGVQKIGDYYYNFWKDKQHERGIWRRTTLAEYRKADPKWETVIDLDALNVAENSKWVWHGADCLRPDYDRCLIALSPGGSDADVTREFDMTSKTWVKNGFFRPEAKGGLGWIDKNTVYVYTDFGPGSLTSSGYPNIVKQWTRGTAMSSATTVYEGKPGDMYIAASHDDTPGYERDWVSRTLAFYNDEMYLRGKDGSLTRLDVPNSMQKSAFREWLYLRPREDWKVGDKTYAAGSLLVANLDAFMAGKRDIEVLFAPTATTSLSDFTLTRDHLVLNVMEDVKNRLIVL